MKQFPYLDLKPQDVEKNPDFCELLTTLGSHLNTKGLSQQTEKDLKQVKIPLFLQYQYNFFSLNVVKLYKKDIKYYCKQQIL